MTDPLVEVALRVYDDFAEHATLAEVLAVVARCRNDLDTPTEAALPEMVERLARQRLTDPPTAPKRFARLPPNAVPSPTGIGEARQPLP